MINTIRGFETRKTLALFFGALMVFSSVSYFLPENIEEPSLVADSTENALPEDLLPGFISDEDVSDTLKARNNLLPRMKVGESLLPFFDHGKLPERAVTKNDRVSIIVIAAIDADLESFASYMDIETKVNLGKFYLITGSIADQQDLQGLTAISGLLLAEADIYLRDFRNQEDIIELDGVRPEIEAPEVFDPRTVDQAFTREFYGIEDLTDTGSGVLVGVSDTGVDFGQTNLAPALGLDSLGYPASLDPGGEFITLTPYSVPVSQGTFKLSDTGLRLPYNSTGMYFNRELPSDEIVFDLTASGITSISGDVKFGIMQQELDAGRWPRYQSFFVLLSDPTTAGVYDTLWIDYRTSAIANWFRGFMYAIYYHTVENIFGPPYLWTQEAWMLSNAVNNSEVLLNFDTANHSMMLWTWWMYMDDTNDWNGNPYTYDDIIGSLKAAITIPTGIFEKAGEWSAVNLAQTQTQINADKIANFVLAKDFDADGYNDISAGSLSNTLDFYNYIGDGVKMVSGIDPYGRGFAYMHDPHGHGTACASAVAGHGIAPYKIYDNYTGGWSDYFPSYPTYYGDYYTQLPDNDTSYNIYGMARNADVMAVNLFTAASYFLQLIWQAGFDLVLPENPLLGSDWVYTGKHQAMISSNSWGWSPEWKFTYGGPGLHFGSVLIDILSTPGYFNSSYQGILFVFSAGNDGIGYGTGGDFSFSSALTVGASTIMHYYDPIYGIQSNHDQLASFSSRGPTLTGWSGVDVLANGFRGCSDTAVWDHGYWDDRPETAGYYGSSGNLTFGWWQGTSLSAPVVAGVAALVCEAAGKTGFDTTFTPWDLKSIIKSTAKDMGFNSFIQGTGRVNPVDAVNLAKELYNSGPATGKYQITSSKTNDENSILLNDLFKYWYGTSAYSDFENLPGAYLNATDFPDTYPANIYDTDFYAGLINPGETSIGNVDLGSNVPNVIPVYDKLKEKYSGMYMTKDADAQVASFYPEKIIPLQLWDMLGFTSNIDFMSYISSNNIVNLEICMSWDGGSSTDGAELGGPAAITWNDADSDGIIDFGEFNMLFGQGSTGHTFHVPIATPLTAFGSGNGTVVLLFTGGSSLNVDGINIDWTVNMFTRESWSWVTASDSNDDGNWAVELTVPAGTDPGQYNGYLKITSGQLCPVSVGVAGIVPDRNEYSNSKSLWTGTKEINDPAFSNYILSVSANDGDNVGTGDYRYFPLSVSYTAATLFVNLTAENSGTELAIWILDELGREFESFSGMGSLVVVIDINSITSTWSSDKIIYLAFKTEYVEGHEIQIFLETAYTDEPLETVTPSILFTAETSDGVNNLEVYPDRMIGPHANITATYQPGTFYPEITVSSIEIYIPDLTSAEIKENLTDTVAAGDTDYQYVDLVAGDNVNVSCGWTGSTDLDVHIYDPSGYLVEFEDGTTYSMATLDNPETGNFIAQETGTYEFEIHEYTGSAAGNYWLVVNVSRESPLASAGNSVTFDTMYINGQPVPDDTYTMEIWGFSNSLIPWIVYQDYTVDNWDVISIIGENTRTVKQGEELVLTWTPFLYAPLYAPVGWVLYLDGNVIDSGSSWTNTTPINLDIISQYYSSGLMDYGTYNFTMEFSAENGTNTIYSRRTTIVDVIGAELTVENTGTVTIDQGDGLYLTWTPYLYTYGDSYSPSGWKLYLDGIDIDTVMGWTNGTPVILDIITQYYPSGSMDPGTYNFTMEFSAFDGSSYIYGSGTIIVQVEVVAAPATITVENVLSVTINQGDDLVLAWTPYLHGDESYAPSGWKLYLDGTMIGSSSLWTNATPITLDIFSLYYPSGLDPGTYSFKMEFSATDGSNDVIGSGTITVLVNEDGETTTTTTTTATTTASDSSPSFTATPGFELIILVVVAIAAADIKRRKK